ncbi:MAG: glycine cleavage system protein GcvH [Candidatus Omnitrophica bacterium]|nr:glycine cleavage system protein GcvH [Candidatus Omnitrophota bacterium]
MKKYTKTHEWVEPDGTRATVGITDHAQGELRDIVFIELPKKGAGVSQGAACAVVESVKAAFDIYAPLSGKVIEINPKIEEDPSLVNQDPEGAGWFFKIEIADAAELDGLLDEVTYYKLLRGEAQ